MPRRKAEKVPAEIIARIGVPVEELEHPRLVVIALLAATDRSISS